ncbi:MAG TPA: DAK2 domain-containing protein [Mycobacteriales bacterium]|nr:DAK2 domain-containing protein [Mycobacteriales bacterium]
MLQVLDAAALRGWCAAALSSLTAAREEIDDLNVYPVPDGDTGTNLVLTMESVRDAIAEASGEMAATASAMTHGALMGARGNSGVILSQLLRGMCEVLGSAPTAKPADLQRALIRATELAYGAVAVPVEGTVLTVAREAAASAAELDTADLAQVVRAAVEGASAALARTPELLAPLKAAGVVDAGGRGLVVVLQALEQVVTGVAAAVVPPLLVPRDRSALVAAREGGSDAYEYEVQYLLRDATQADVDTLRANLSGLGDSLLIAGGDDLWNVHVHVNDVGAALEAGVEAGRPFRIAVTRFADQIGADTGTGAPSEVAERTGRRVVAVAAGAGLARLFEEAGAEVVIGGPTANPSTRELLDGVRRAGAAEVVLLPNDANTTAAASAAAAEARAGGITVTVVPTRAAVQGLAALAVADPERTFADDVAAMADAAGSTRWAEVTTAVRESATSAGICRPGDVLGLIEGDVVLIGTDVAETARALLDRLLLGGGELVTVLAGEQAEEGLASQLVAHVEGTHPGVEAVAYDGGQPHYPLLLGVE